MNIVIIGAGAMGSIFGAMLHPVARVTLVNRSTPHVEAIQRQGLTIEDAAGNRRLLRVEATTEPERLTPDFDLAIVFTKSYDTADAARTAESLLKADGLALTLQNGLGNLDVLLSAVGPGRAAAGVTSHGGTLVEPGLVRHAGAGPTLLGAPSPATNLAPVAEVFGRAGIATTVSPELDSVIWGKLVVNVGINALAAILRVPNGILGAEPVCERLMSAAVDEAVAVAKASGIALPYDDPLAYVKKVCADTGPNRASMLQDVLAGERTEIGVINRAIVDRGAALGVSTPVNRLLTEIVSALEATRAHRV